jgi:hypothetical protein
MFPDHLRPAVALVTLCLIFVQGRAHQAQQLPPAPPVAQASRANVAPVLDGRILDDPAWQDVPALVEFWQTAPDAGQPSSERTEVRIVYTETAIYFGVMLLDRDPTGLTTSDSRRDSPLDDTDSFRIVLDTYRDRQNGFVFATTPSGLEYDQRGWMVGGVRDSLQDAALRARHGTRVGCQLPAHDPASQGDRILGAAADSIRSDARVACRCTDGTRLAGAAEPRAHPVHAR